MTKAVTLYTEKGEILGWWIGEIHNDKSGRFIRLIGNNKQEPILDPGKIADEIPFEYLELPLETVQLRNIENVTKTLRYIMAPNRIHAQLAKLTQFVKWPGRFPS